MSEPLAVSDAVAFDGRTRSSSRRGADQNDVSERVLIDLAARVTPADSQRLDQAARAAGVTRAEMVRRLIRALPDPVRP